MAEEIKVSVVFATAGAKRNVKEFTGELKEMERETGKVSKKTDGSFKSMRSSAARNLGRAGLAGIAVAASGAVVLGYNRMMDKGKEYENSLADLEAITGITGSQLEELSGNALDLSVKYGEAANNIIEANKLVASQLAEKIDFGTDEGLQQLQDVSEQAIILQKAAGVDLATSVRTLTTAINQFNLPASETERLINSIAAGSKFGAAEVADQAEAYREAGSVAASANLSFEDLNASTQVLAANAITGSRAGTQMRNVFLTLNNSSKLAEQGIEGVDLQSDGLSATLEKLKPLLEDSAALEKLFGREAITAAQILIRNADSVETMTEKVTDSNVAQEQLNSQMNTFQTAQSQLSSALDKELIAAFQETNGIGISLMNTLKSLIETTGRFTRQVNKFWSESARISNIASSLGEDVVAHHSEAKAILEELTQQTETYNREVDVSAGYVKNLTSQLEGMEEGSELYDSLTETVTDNRLALELSEMAARNLVETTKEQISTAKDNGESTGLLEEQYKEYLRRLSHVQEAIETLNTLNLENEDSNLKTETSVKNLAEKREELKKRIEELILKSGDLTEAEETELVALKAQDKALERQIKLRKELANTPIQTQVQKPGDDIITPELPTLEFDTDFGGPMNVLKAIASDSRNELYQLNNEIERFVDVSSILGDHSNDIAFALGETEAAIVSVMGMYQDQMDAVEQKYRDGKISYEEYQAALKEIEGYRAQDQALDSLEDKYDELKRAQQAQHALMQSLANEQIETLADIGNAVREQVLTAIKARIAETIAVQIAKIIGSVPFPLNIAIAAGTGAAISALFNQIPKFESGGAVAGRRHSQGGTLIEAEKDEYVINRISANSAPSALRAINSDPRIAKQVESYVTGTTPEPVPFKADFSASRQAPSSGGNNRDLVEALDRQSKALEALPDEFNFPIDKFHSQYKKFLEKEAGL